MQNSIVIFNRLSLLGEKWHTHRKMITPTFHFKILENFVDVFSEKSIILITKLQEEVGSVGFDVCQYVTLCALDIICGEYLNTAANFNDYCNEYCSDECIVQDNMGRTIFASIHVLNSYVTQYS
jgi:hypothetical protein